MPFPRVCNTKLHRRTGCLLVRPLLPEKPSYTYIFDKSCKHWQDRIPLSLDETGTISRISHMQQIYWSQDWKH